MGTCIERGCFANANVSKVRDRHNTPGIVPLLRIFLLWNLVQHRSGYGAENTMCPCLRVGGKGQQAAL